MQILLHLYYINTERPLDDSCGFQAPPCGMAPSWVQLSVREPKRQLRGCTWAFTRSLALS